MSIQDLIETLQDAQAQGVHTVEVHTQSHYPLKGGIANVRVLDGTLAIACSNMDEYGSGKAWDDPETEGCVECGGPVSDPDDELCRCCI